MSTLICIPTFNEADNIDALLSAILELNLNAEILIIDDNSPDKTAEAVRNFSNHHCDGDRVKVITRATKSGRGAAVWFGIRSGLRKDHEAIIEMDADFSHRPRDLAEGIRLLKAGNDVVIGARYPNGNIINWPISRRVFSFLSNQLARLLLSREIHDYTNGFRFYSHKAATLLCNSEMREDGYINLSESLSICLRHRLLITSFPIVFVNRNMGKSNTSFREIAEALRAIFRISFNHHFVKKP